MKLIDKIQPITNNDAQRHLFTQIKELNNSFWKRMTAVQLDPEHHNIYFDVIRDFETNYKSLNKQFRSIFFDCASAQTNVNLYTRAYNNRKMIDMLRMRHPEYITTDLNGFTKFMFNIQIVSELFKEQLYMMFAQYGKRFHYLQFLISYTKCLIEYFIADDVDWAVAQTLLLEFYQNVDYDELLAGAGFYGVAVRTRKSGLKYNTKTSNIDTQIRIMLDSGMKRKDIAKELNISDKTLYNKIKNNLYLQ